MECVPSAKRVSRRVGELASKRARDRGSMWSTRRLNDMDPLSLVGYAFGADATGILALAVINHSPGLVRWPIPERPQVIG
jgi:hypothetical protein